VLNTDNINVTGESFDYGPWRFAPEWEPGFTAAYFDHAGLYAFGRQPEAIQWNLAQLAGCLALLTDDRDGLSQRLAGFAETFHTALAAALVRRIGVAPASEEADRELARAITGAMAARTTTIDRFFFDWRGGERPTAQAYAGEPFETLAGLLEGRRGLQTHAYWADEAPCSLHIDEVEAIWAPIADEDDWSAFEAKIAAIRRMGEAMAEA
jgi:uncharacterized protein YdiU (UPF0061 family)